jgi:hypothetical protein
MACFFGDQKMNLDFPNGEYQYLKHSIGSTKSKLNWDMLVMSKPSKAFKIDNMELPKNRYNGWLEVARLV